VHDLSRKWDDPDPVGLGVATHEVAADLADALLDEELAQVVEVAPAQGERLTRGRRPPYASTSSRGRQCPSTASPRAVT
jgi:hypothetical protein